MTDTHHPLGIWKIAVAWAGMAFGSIDLHATLSIIALVLTIVFTSLQIYKHVREILRERRLERFADKMKAPTGPAPL